MDAENRRSLSPDVVIIRLHHHPHEWNDDAPPTVYKFRVMGKPWGQRWVVHSIYASRPAPPGLTRRNMTALKQVLSAALSEHFGGREILPWQSDLLAWEDE
tara:strand:- start:592 stop:894 length:303 start_codon:yes stop_codon:yes gene_type:complete